MIQLVTEPTVETPTLRPLRSSAVFTLSSLRTTSANSSGGPAMAAMPFTGEPFTMKARPGPEPSATSMPSAAIACCRRASPPKLLISISTPLRLKMPVRCADVGRHERERLASSLADAQCVGGDGR